jgi:hypothetical protein
MHHVNLSPDEKSALLKLPRTFPKSVGVIVEHFLDGLGAGTSRRTPKEIDDLKFGILSQLRQFPETWTERKAVAVRWVAGRAKHFEERGFYNLAAELNALAAMLDARWGK